MNTTASLQALVQAGLAGTTDRRSLVKLAGAAAAAAGLTTATPFARQSSAQADQNIFIFGSGQDISNLDPHTGSDYSIIWGQRAVYDALMRYKGDPVELLPGLAKEVTGSDDAKTWSIVLDERATFQDGSPVNAEAVRWNFNRMLSRNKGNAWMFAAVMDQESAQVVDEQTLEVNLINPFAPFDLILPYMLIANPAIVDEHAGDDEGESWLLENAAGSGPYEITRFEPGNIYQFDRFADYWNTDITEGMVDTFVWRIIRESSTKRIALESGEIQYGDTFSTEDILALEGDDRFIVNQKASFGPFQLKMNNQVGPTADLNVRKALTAAFDYEAAIESLSGRGERMNGPLPVRFTPWNNEDLPLLEHNMDAAREYLAASEYPDGFDIEYVYVTGLAFEETFGLILLEKCAELNINVTMTPLVWPDMVARASSPETMPGLMCVLASSNYLDPDNFLWAQYHSSQAGSWSAASWFQNEELDALLEQGRSTIDPDDRKAIYDQVQAMLVENATEIWMYSETPNDAWVKELGENARVLGGGGDIRNISYQG
ncbi:MAG TPA: ABC transporter substrate-binding protein [Thermomicrobiales bacterium]|nr:ABC transporter substrate-binding protein [Thermomicrobiales bacterium]